MIQLKEVILLLPGLNQAEEIKLTIVNNVADKKTLVGKWTDVEESDFELISTERRAGRSGYAS